MALWTTADRDTIKAALLTAATEGVAQVSVGGQAVQTYSLEQLKKILDMIQADLAAENTNASMGMRFRRTVPPAAG